ncbi:MAG: MFS transporter, partial [Syntrophales bacterium]|nr:MFS transporter [Syntrophales bacterium]
ARFPVGWLGDYIEPRWILTGVFAIGFICLGFVWQAPSMTMLLITGGCLGACYGTMLVLLPTVIANYYSAASYASLNAVIMPIQAGVAAIAPIGAGYIFDYTRSYNAAYIILMTMFAIGAIMSAVSVPPSKKAA